MPASTLEPVNAALRTALSKNSCNNSLDSQLAGATKKALLSNIEFEAAGSYQSSVLDKLKSKYIVLKSSEPLEASKQKQNKSQNMGADEGLGLAKCELYPLKSVQLGWNNADWSVGAGMVNMGNTCYLNSTLQALFHVPALVNWLISEKQHMAECEDSGGTLCIICAMRKTLQDSQQRNISSIRPYLIYNKLRLLCKNLLPGRQEDAHEFLRYLVEAMEKAYLSRFKNHSEFDSRTKETTPLNQILGGYLRSAVRCLECGNVSTTFQHFQDVLLDIRKAQTLDEALEAYFSREKLDDASYHCESCNKKVPAWKQFLLERAPMVLCIQLKRFSISNNKITKHLQFRQRLDMTRYVRRRPVSSLIYKLVALVTHMGPTVNCGHYTAIAQAPSGNYFQFDDSVVKPISHQAVFGTNAYIMLYELEPTSLLQTNGKVKIPSTITEKNLQKENKPLPTSTLTLSNLKTVDSSTEIKAPKAPLAPKATNFTNNSIEGVALPKPVVSSSNISSTSTDAPPGHEKANNVQTTTKLVPYDMDDSSDCSEESHNNGAAEPNTRIPTKVSVGDWKVSSSTDAVPEPSLEGSTWDKKSSTVTKLLRMSHEGYAAPVTTWNGTRSHLDKEISNERREERKRALLDDSDQGRVKHQKMNSNGSHNSNSYNPIQEYHNNKNWNTGNGPQRYRMFYNTGKRHRNDRRNYHHNNYHKNHRFRH